MNLHQRKENELFETKVITGAIMVGCSFLPAFWLTCALPFPIIALLLFALMWYVRRGWFLYFLLSIISNWFFGFFLWISYNDLFVDKSGGSGQTFMWLLLIFGIPMLCGFAVGVAGNFLIWYSKRHCPASETVSSPVIDFAPVKSSNSVTPLLGAIITGDLDLVRTALQEHPEQLNTAYAQNGNTPLHVAALNGKAEIVKLLLSQPGIDKTIKNNNGQTAAELAQEKGFAEISGLLK